jgi:hypothetical protein
LDETQSGMSLVDRSDIWLARSVANNWPECFRSKLSMRLGTHSPATAKAALICLHSLNGLSSLRASPLEERNRLIVVNQPIAQPN